MKIFAEFRESQVKRVEESNGALEMTDVTAVNLTMLSGGVQSNVLPSLISVTYDIRLAVDANLDEFEDTVRISIF